MRKLFFIILVSIISSSWISAEEEILRSIVQVRSLSPERAALKIPVILEAQVLKIAPTGHGLFIHDEEFGIYMARKGAWNFSNVKQGQIIRVEGVTNPGQFVPHIDALKVTLLDVRPLPEPLRPNREMLYRPSMDCRWIELRGVIIDNVPQGLATSLRIESFGSIINLVLPNTPEVKAMVDNYRNRMVVVRGVATTRSNEKRQMIGRQMQVNSLDDVRLLDLSQEELPLLEIDQLLRLENGDLKASRIQGVVLYVNRNVLYLEGKEGNLKVVAAKKDHWEIGEKVEAIGSVVVDLFSPALRAWQVTSLESVEALPEAIPMPLGGAVFPLPLQHAFVEVEARLVDSRKTKDSISLSCTVKGRVFEANLDIMGGAMPALEPNSVLKLQGICLLRSSQDRAHSFQPDGFSLLLRSPRDITVLQTPPWWTLRKALSIAGLVLILTLISLAWVGLLHRQVAEQTGVIGAQLEREVRTRERQRLARELHDSLEQNLTGVAMQLGSIEKKLKNGQASETGESVTLAQKMVAYCQRESRESIYDLRRSGEGALSEITHDELLLNEAEICQATIEVSTEGKPYPILNTASNHLTKFVREATLNALRHGEATLIEVDYQYSDNGIEIRVKDNGCGFDTHSPPPKGHFGIRGMRERASRLNGGLTIESLVGKGSSLTLKLPKGEALVEK